jgi:hypothetical protein
METKDIRKTSSLVALCILSFAGMAIAGQSDTAPPVPRACVHHHNARFTHGNYVAVVSPTYQTGMDFNNPVVGPPLYYQGDNLNWEEAPAFGLWR